MSIDQARLFFPLLLLIYSQTYISAPKDVVNAPASLNGREAHVQG